MFSLQASFLAGYMYMLLAVTGIVLNAYVIARLIQLALNDYVGHAGVCSHAVRCCRSGSSTAAAFRWPP